MKTTKETKKIPKLEELETIAMGQEAIISNEGVMKFIGDDIKIDLNPFGKYETERFLTFLSEIIDNGKTSYKKVKVKPYILPLEYSKEIIGEDKCREYVLCKRRWEIFKLKCHTM